MWQHAAGGVVGRHGCNNDRGRLNGGPQLRRGVRHVPASAPQRRHAIHNPVQGALQGQRLLQRVVLHGRADPATVQRRARSMTIRHTTAIRCGCGCCCGCSGRGPFQMPQGLQRRFHGRGIRAHRQGAGHFFAQYRSATAASASSSTIVSSFVGIHRNRRHRRAVLWAIMVRRSG